MSRPILLWFFPKISFNLYSKCDFHPRYWCFLTRRTAVLLSGRVTIRHGFVWGTHHFLPGILRRFRCILYRRSSWCFRLPCSRFCSLWGFLDEDQRLAFLAASCLMHFGVYGRSARGFLEGSGTSELQEGVLRLPPNRTLFAPRVRDVGGFWSGNLDGNSGPAEEAQPEQEMQLSRLR